MEEKKSHADAKIRKIDYGTIIEFIKKTQIPLIIVTSLFYLIYNISYVGIFPEIKNISEVVSLVFIFVLFVFIIFILLVFILIPLFMLKSAGIYYDKFGNKLWNIFMLSIAIFIFGYLLSIFYNISNYSAPVTILAAAVLPPIIFLPKKKENIKYMLYLPFVLIVLNPISTIIAFSGFGGSSDAVGIFVLSVQLFLSVLVNLFLYEKNKNNILSAIVAVVIVIITIYSMLFNVAGKDNIFIYRPFEMLKIGHYKETLYFKEDTLNIYKKELLEDKNTTHAKFCILSSLGSEYIVQKVINANKMKKTPERCDKNITYRIDKNNLAGFKTIKNATSGNDSDLNDTK